LNNDYFEVSQKHTNPFDLRSKSTKATRESCFFC